MKIEKWLRGTEERAEPATVGTVQLEDTLLCALLGAGQITKEMALQVPTVSGGIDLIAGVIASTPIKLYRDNGGKAEEVSDDPRLRLLNDETGDTLNANEFWRAMIRDYYTSKGGYAYIHREHGEIKSLHYVDEAQISIQKNTDPIFKQFQILVEGKAYWPFDFLRILRNAKDGAQGVPITVESGKLIEAAYAALVFERNLVRRGGNKKGFLQSETRLGQPELDSLRDAFARVYRGDGTDGDGSESFVVLNKGVSFNPSSATSVEMQLNENKLSNATEFAKIFHIAPEVVSGSADGAQSTNLAKLAAIPLMVTIQCALNRDLLLESEKKKLYFAFDTKELLRGDMAQRFAAYKTALDANFMQIDEVRYAEDLEPLGLDWIKLGLQDVLYNPKTKELFTPNTGITARIDGQKAKPAEEEPERPLQNAPEDDTMEERARGKPIRGEKGRFAGSEPGIRTDSKGIPFKKPALHLPKEEYGKVMHEISTNYHKRFENEKESYLYTMYGDNYYVYSFESHGFGEYNIYKKELIL